MAAVERLGAHSDRLGNLALVEQDAAASVWCIDVAFLVARYIHRDAFGDLPRRLLLGTVLDIHPDAEIQDRTMPASEPAAILAYPVRGTMSGGPRDDGRPLSFARQFWPPHRGHNLLQN